MYLDPGFGSMVIQAIIALIAGSGAYFFIIRKKLSSAFSKKKKNNEDMDSTLDEVVDTQNERV